MKTDSLANLHGFYLPPSPSWTPQTIGWYVVFGLLALLAGRIAWRMLADWRRNRYRREALREVKIASIGEIPVLLKRTGLAAWPREQVASLSGESWLAFLEAHGSFPRRLFEEIHEYQKEPASDEGAVRKAVSDWIRSHRVRV